MDNGTEPQAPATPSRKGSLTLDRIQSALSFSSKRVEAEALARGFKLFKEKDAPPEVCPDFDPGAVVQKSTSIFSCFRSSATIQGDVEALKRKHEEVREGLGGEGRGGKHPPPSSQGERTGPCRRSSRTAPAMFCR